MHQQAVDKSTHLPSSCLPRSMSSATDFPSRMNSRIWTDMDITWIRFSLWTKCNQTSLLFPHKRKRRDFFCYSQNKGFKKLGWNPYLRCYEGNSFRVVERNSPGKSFLCKHTCCMKGKLVDFSRCQLHFFAISLFQIASHHKQTSNLKPFNSCTCNGNKIELCSRTSALLKAFISMGKEQNVRFRSASTNPKTKIQKSSHAIHAFMRSWNNNPLSSKIQFSSHSLKVFISLEQAKKIMDSIRTSQHKQLIFQIFMNLSIHALAENTLRFQKHPITPLGEKVSFLSRENVCFMKLLHSTYISQKKNPKQHHVCQKYFLLLWSFFVQTQAKTSKQSSYLNTKHIHDPNSTKKHYNMTKLQGPNFQNAIKCQRKEGRKLKLTAIFSNGLSTRDDEMKKKKKKNVLILLHTYFSPTTPPKIKTFVKRFA